MNNKLNVIIDTNVIVSALLSKYEDSATVKVLNLFYENKINLYYSTEIIKEYKDVLNRDAFKFDKKIIENILRLVSLRGIKIDPKKIELKTIDKKDQPFYELVMDKNIDDGKLLTGNIKHFPKEKYIMTPADFIKKFFT